MSVVQLCPRLNRPIFQLVDIRNLCQKLKANKALDENSSLNYGASPAIWDHTV